MQAQWRLKNSANDTSGNGHNLVLTNGPTFVTDTKEGSHALQLDGVNHYGDAGVFDVGGHFAFSGWVKIASTRTNIQTILSNSGSGSNTNGFRLFVNSSGTSDGKIVLKPAMARPPPRPPPRRERLSSTSGTTSWSAWTAPPAWPASIATASTRRSAPPSAPILPPVAP